RQKESQARTRNRRIISKSGVCGWMLPAGFEPASEARKAPILDRTRLRERKAGLVPNPINAFGNETHTRHKTGNFLHALTFGGQECAARSRRSRNCRSSCADSS